ncbi:MAG TPA: NUDIX domain-containing protein [Woeseiaceae bacterium]|nr:NUDIX domain-containing protein [Woeseiaceae bacterium]
MPGLPIRCDMVSIVVLKGAGAATEVLLVRRAAAYLRGVWSYIAGHVEPHEKGWQTAQRELAEETGLVPTAMYATSFCEQFYAAAADCIMVVPAFVAYMHDSCEVRLNEENDAYHWLSFDDAMQELPFGSQRELLAYVHREFIVRPPSPHLRIDIG